MVLSVLIDLWCNTQRIWNQQDHIFFSSARISYKGLKYLRALKRHHKFAYSGLCFAFFLCFKVSPLIFQNMALILQGYDLWIIASQCRSCVARKLNVFTTDGFSPTTNQNSPAPRNCAPWQPCLFCLGRARINFTGYLLQIQRYLFWVKLCSNWLITKVIFII